MYEDLAHAVQTGIALYAQSHPETLEPKHLRVGISLALRDHTSLADLLIEKGVITNEEYRNAILDGMMKEKALYEDLVGARLA